VADIILHLDMPARIATEEEWKLVMLRLALLGKTRIRSYAPGAAQMAPTCAVCNNWPMLYFMTDATFGAVCPECGTRYLREDWNERWTDDCAR
jgi:hypothetical protein